MPTAIGAATARRCAEAGARVVLLARSLAALEEQAAAIERAGGTALVAPADVTRDDEVAGAVAAALARFGQIDVLINNAGFGRLNPIAEAPASELEALLQVNLIGAARCIQVVLPHMLAQGRGQIVNIASLAGLLAMPSFAYYGATKAGLIALGRSIQQDLTGSGVRCVTICPGVARTPFWRNAGIGKLPRTALLLPWLSEDDVAGVVVDAILREREGELVVPALAAPLMSLAGALPALARLVVRFFK